MVHATSLAAFAAKQAADAMLRTAYKHLPSSVYKFNVRVFVCGARRSS